MKIFSLAILFMLSSCSLTYVMKQGVSQVELLKDAEPIVMALRSKDLDLAKRKKLELIQDVRRFSKELGMKAENYQNVNLHWDKVLTTVSGSKALSFEPYRWWFPIIGYVPYKGFFEKSDAILEQNKLKNQGYDTQLGRVDGYSTLGFFSDPVWPSMLNLSDGALVELIIHELTHETIYFSGQTTFNETLASFVAKTASKKYMSDNFGENSPQYQELVKYYRDYEQYQKFFYGLYQELDELYKSDKNDEQKTLEKKAILLSAQKKYEELISPEFRQLDWTRVNNAYLMAFKSYNHDDPVFSELLEQLNNNFPQFFIELKYYAATPDPFQSLRERVSKLKEAKDGKV